MPLEITVPEVTLPEITVPLDIVCPPSGETVNVTVSFKVNMTFAVRCIPPTEESSVLTTGWKYPTVTLQNTTGSPWTGVSNIQANDGTYAVTEPNDDGTSQNLVGASYAFGIPYNAVIDSVDWETAIRGGDPLTRYIVDGLNNRVTSNRLLDLDHVSASRQVETHLASTLNVFSTAELLGDDFRLEMYIDNEDGAGASTHCETDYFGVRVNYHIPPGTTELDNFHLVTIANISAGRYGFSSATSPLDAFGSCVPLASNGGMDGIQMLNGVVCDMALFDIDLQTLTFYVRVSSMPGAVDCGPSAAGVFNRLLYSNIGEDIGNYLPLVSATSGTTTGFTGGFLYRYWTFPGLGDLGSSGSFNARFV